MKVGRVLITVAAAGALAAAGGGIVYANVAGGVVNACVADRTGTVTVPSGSTCPKGTTPLSWNQVGPRGPAGPQGVPGATGAPGTAMGLVYLDREVTVPRGDETFKEYRASCPAGAQIVSGSVRRMTTNGYYSLGHQYADESNGSGAWVFRAAYAERYDQNPPVWEPVGPSPAPGGEDTPASASPSPAPSPTPTDAYEKPDWDKDATVYVRIVCAPTQ